MRLHWSYSNMPELTELSDSERRHVVGRAWFWAHRRWPPWVGLAGVALAGAAGRALGSAIGHEAAGEMIGTIVGALIYVQIVVEVARSVVRDAVERRRRQ
jgi:hypothetical protein